jgi:hypothetical protein
VGTRERKHSFLVPGGRSVLHCSIFCSVGGRIHWHLRLVWGAATAFIALLAVAGIELSRTSEVLRHVFFILGILFWFCHRSFL